MLLRPALLALALLLPSAIPAGESPRFARKANAPTRDTLRVGQGRLAIEIANNDSLRVQGLSDRASLGWNEGMLFVFPEAERRSFWMIDCQFDIDIAYIAPDGTIRDILTMRIEPGVPPQDLARYPSSTRDIQYALEVNRGWFSAHGVRVGQRIEGILKHRATR